MSWEIHAGTDPSGVLVAAGVADANCSLPRSRFTACDASPVPFSPFPTPQPTPAARRRALLEAPSGGGISDVISDAAVGASVAGPLPVPPPSANAAAAAERQRRAAKLQRRLLGWRHDDHEAMYHTRSSAADDADNQYGADDDVAAAAVLHHRDHAVAVGGRSLFHSSDAASHAVRALLAKARALASGIGRGFGLKSPGDENTMAEGANDDDDEEEEEEVAEVAAAAARGAGPAEMTRKARFAAERLVSAVCTAQHFRHGFSPSLMVQGRPFFSFIFFRARCS